MIRIAVAAWLLGLLASAGIASPCLTPPLDSEREIRELVAALSSKSPWSRHAAAGRLLREGIETEAALAAIAKDLRHEQFEVRLDAVTELVAGRDDEVDRLAVSVLIEALRHDDPQVRKRGAGLLPPFGAAAVPALPALRDALRDPDRTVRGKAVTSMARVDPAKATAVILPLLRDTDVSVRAQVVRELGNLGVSAKAAVPALLEARKDTDSRIRREVAQSLGQIGGDAVVPALVEMLRRDKAPSVRVGAMRGLRALANDGHPLPLAVVEGLCDPAIEVRTIVSRTICQTEDPRLVPALCDALKMRGLAPMMAAVALGRFGDLARPAVPALLEALASGEPAVAKRAARALGEIGGAEAGRGLVRALLRDPAGGLTWAICEGLEDVGVHGRDAVPVLVVMLEGTDRRAALGALGGVGGDAARRAVLATLRESKDPEMRQHALYAIRDLAPGSVEAIQTLVEILRNDPDHAMRDRAASALFRIGTDDAIDALIKALGDPHPHVRDHVLGKLVQLKATDRIPLETLTILAVDEYRRVASQATSLLAARDGSDADWAILGVFMRNRHLVALRAVPAAGEVAVAARAAMIESAREHRDPEIRLGALVWLVEHDRAAAKPLLLESLVPPPEDTPLWRRAWKIRAGAAELLAKLDGKDPAVIAALGKALEDDSRSVRRAASGALEKIRAR